MRAHPLTFEIEDGEMSGRMVATVCKLGAGPTEDPDPVADEEKPKIHFDFTASYERVSDEAIAIDGTFEIADGTQRYADLTGSGEITGYFFCFEPEGCEGGVFDDGQFVLRGDYSHPDPQLDDPEPRAEEPAEH